MAAFRLALEADVAGAEANHLCPSSSGEDEGREDGAVAPAGDRVRDDRQEPPDLVGSQPSRRSRDRPRALDSVARVADEEAHPAEEPEVRGEAGDPGADRRR